MKKSIEITAPHKFKPREYQLEAMKSLDSGIKRAVICWARGLGKDLFSLNYLIKRAVVDPGVYLHCFPNFNQAKRAIWKSNHQTHDGETISYLDHFPKELIKHKNSSEMMIQLKNGSIYCLMGLDGKNASRARGMNPKFAILSEYAFMDPESWQTIEPRITQNNGTVIFISTPNGKNHFYELYNHAKTDKNNYFTSLKTVVESESLTLSDIEKIRNEGVPEDFIQQEYFCSFERGSRGSYYGNLIQKARDERRIGKVHVQNDLLAHTAWDIGVGDNTAIWIFQRSYDGCISFVNYYENHGEGLDHYIKYLNEWKIKNNVEFGKHFVPHDMQNREFTSGVDRLQTAREYGYNMTVLPKKPISEGIQAVRFILHSALFDEENCRYGIKCLDFYRKRYNDSLKIYYDEPCHDKWSDGADAMRYAAIGIRGIGFSGSSAKDDYDAINNYFGKL